MIVVIEAISIEGQNLSLIFEHIDVLSNHPMNNTGLNMYTGRAKIKLIDYELKNLFYTIHLKLKAREG